MAAVADVDSVTAIVLMTDVTGILPEVKDVTEWDAALDMVEA